MTYVLISDFLKNQVVIRVKNETKIKWRGKKLLCFTEEILKELPGYFEVDQRGNMIKCDHLVKEKLLREYWDDIELIGNNEEIYRD